MKSKNICLFILNIIMIFSVCIGYIPADAKSEDVLADSAGICGHHLQHTDECGYAEAAEGHTCSHVHDELCGYVEAADEIPCDQECTDIDGDGVIDHVEGCGYQPPVEEKSCTHVHDENCGYIAPSESSPCSYAVNGCPYCVVSWEWVDEQELLTQSDGIWGMGFAGVSEEKPLTRESLLQLLPGEVSVTVDSGETRTLAVVWDMDTFPEEGAGSGEYTVTARLAETAEGFSFTDDADPLAVTVQLGGGETWSTTLPSGTMPFSQHIVNGVSPNGTTINLFDYWLTGQTDSDNTNPDWLINKGINNGHALIFQESAQASKGIWNVWTGNKAPRTGIVASHLVDGYPRLNINTATASDANIQVRDGSESLAYLYDPKIAHEGKAVYEDVQGLLQVDNQGYYYYNSQKNYAAYYADANSFALYQYPGILPGGKSPVGQFFPFNAATVDAQSVFYQNQWHTLMNTDASTDTSINHYFGMHMSTRFIQQNGGYTDGSQKTPVTYEFSGDDDVWIFIDGILVADLGGIHDAASVSINFATGAVYINDSNGNGRQDYGEDGYAYYRLGNKMGLGADTLPDNTYHTLDFFYLERGNIDSNLYLKYNLVTIPESDLIKIDQIGDPVAGAEFTLYGAADYADHGTNAVPIATGTTDGSGEFVFLKTDDAGNSFPITIDELYNSYGKTQDSENNNLILVETRTPAGYRTVGEIGLYFYISESDEVLLLSNSIWDQGAYAMPKVITTTSNSIQLLQNPNDVTGTAIQGIVHLVGNGSVENPLMFAVVFQKQKNGTWLPVSGDPLSGWVIQEGSTWDNILAAAQHNPYILQIASSGAYQVEIANLPGDIRNYYHVCKDEQKAKYTIAYYYTTADSLSGATQENTWRINSEAADHAYNMDRVFAMDLYVTNIKNRLLVQKVDEDGATVNGAQFALYKKEDVTVINDTVTVNTGALPYDSLTTAYMSGILNLDGGGAFPTEGHVLEAGEYYLIETTAPVGYKLNETTVHVIVDNTGVYADAGTQDDGITVLRGVGSVMRSMLQFAADDDVDTTLNSIKAALAGSVEYKGYDRNGSFIVSDADWDHGKVLHLQYTNANSLLDYGLYNGAEGTIDNLTLATEAGWSLLKIRQCYQHDSEVNTDLKLNLESMGYEDITGLFSGTVTVRISNDKTGNLKISKTVTGEGAPANQNFTFTVKVTDDNGLLSGTYETLSADGSRGSIAFNNGEAVVTLKAGESLTILALPAGAQYGAEETDVPPGYSPSVTFSGDPAAELSGICVTGTIPHNTAEDQAAELKYENHFDGKAHLALTGEKNLEGRNLKSDDSFSFTLAAGNDETLAAVNVGEVVLPKLCTATVTGDGTGDLAEFSFDEIVFKKEGTYVFHIEENVPDGVSDESPVSGDIWYDTHVTAVTVTVTKDPVTGILSAEAAYDNKGNLSGSKKTSKAVFANLWSGLTVSKTVTGDMGDRDKAFNFQMILTDSSGTALTGDYRYTSGSTTGMLTLDSSGTTVFTLKHNQSISIFGLPAGSRYLISEPDAKEDGYTTTVTIGKDSGKAQKAEGTLSGSDSVYITFQNNRSHVPVTGILLNDWPWILAIGFTVITAGTLFFTERNARKKRRRKGRKQFDR